VRGTFPSRKPGWIVRSTLAFVAQASCLWGHWASRPMIFLQRRRALPGRDAQAPHRRDACATMLLAALNRYRHGEASLPLENELICIC